jgi:hypothetical protein
LKSLLIFILVFFLQPSALCSTASITITVGAPQPPTAVNISIVTYQATAVSTLVLSDNIQGATPFNLSSLSVTSGPAHGTTSVNATTGAITYTPDNYYWGSDQYTYLVCDEQNLCASATVSVEVKPVGPTAVPDFSSTSYRVTVEIDVLANDKPLGPAPLRPPIISEPPSLQEGIAFVTAQNTISFTPAANFDGTATLKYELCDTSSPKLCATALVQITVSGEPPIASPDVASVDQVNCLANMFSIFLSLSPCQDGATISIDVLANDLAPGKIPSPGLVNDSLSIAAPPSHGTASVNATDHSILYTPALHYHGPDFLQYRICDVSRPISQCAIGNVTINVRARPPLAQADSSNVTYMGTVSINVLANDIPGPAGLETLTILIAPSQLEGSTIVEAGKSISFTGAENFVGTASFTYRICDASVPQPLCSDAVVLVTVIGIPPVPLPDTATVDEDGAAITITVLANDGHPGAALDPSKVSIKAAPDNGGRATVNADGTILFAPATHYYGLDTFVYQVCDVATPTSLCATANVTVTVKELPPLAVADAREVAYRGTLEINVTANDVAGPAGIATVRITTGPSAEQGTASVLANGNVLFTAAANFDGTASLTYEICDRSIPAPLCSSALVQIGVNGTIPIASPDLAAMVEDGAAITIVVLENDVATGAALNPASVSLVFAPSGRAIVNADGSVLYAPVTHFYGQDLFTYQVCDIATPFANCATANVTVTIAPNGPIARADTASVSYKQSVDVDVLGNDAFGSAFPTALSILVAPPSSTGTATVTSSNHIAFTGAENFAGTASFTYRVCDASIPQPLCSDAIVLVTVNGVPPVPLPDTATVDEDGAAITITVLANDGHPGAALNASSVSVKAAPDQGGSATVNADGTIRYAPATHYYGLDTFVYQVCDVATPTSLCATASVTVTVNKLPPVAVADARQVAYKGTLEINVTTNDVAGPAGIATVRITTGPSADQGTASVLANANVEYTAAENFAGTASLTYEICDRSVPAPLCSSALVQIAVIGIPPVAAPDLAFVDEDGAAITISVLANDASPGAALDPASVSISLAFLGNATVNADGSIRYQPNVHHHGDDVFTYRVCDVAKPVPFCSSANVTVGVKPLPPRAVSDFANVTYVGTIGLDVLGNDIPGPAGLETLTIPIAPAQIEGTASIAANKTVLFTAAQNFAGTTSFTYRVCDASIPQPLCSDAQVFVTVIGIPPVPAPDTATVDEDGAAITITVLANDGHPGAALDPSKVSIKAAPGQGGSATVNGDGTIRFAPATHYYGLDTFVYQVCDVATPTSLCGTANVTVTVKELPPLAVSDAREVAYRGTLEINVTANDIPGPAGIASLNITSAPIADQGTASVLANGNIAFAAAANFDGTASLTYEICDRSVPLPLCSSALVQFAVVGIPPVVLPDAATVDQNAAALIIFVLANDQFAAGSSLNASSVTFLSSFSHALSASINPDGSVSYRPATAYYGSDKATYQVCDTQTPTALCSSAEIAVTITPKGPIAVDDGAETDYLIPVNINALTNDIAGAQPIQIGSVTHNADTALVTYDGATGIFRYSPPASFSYVKYSFQYTACDNSTPAPLCSNATVTITVRAPNPPTCYTADLPAVDEATPSSFSAKDYVYPGATGLDYGTLVVLSQPTDPLGVLVISKGNGSIAYNPKTVPQPWYGSDSYEYEICDMQNLCCAATVIVKYRPVGPSAQGDSATVVQNGVVIIPVLANDQAGPGGLVTLTISNAPSASQGTAAVTASNEIQFVPAANFDGVVSFQYQICDGSWTNLETGSYFLTPGPLCSIGKVTVGVNTTSPIAADDQYSLNQNAAATVLDVLRNDKAGTAPINTASVALLSQPNHGTATPNANGTISYTPATGYYGSDSFTYNVCDLSTPTVLCSNVATVNVTINGVGPTAVNDAASTAYLIPVSINVLANDTAGAQPIQAASITYTGDRTLISYDGNGTFTYSPPAGFYGPYAFQYTECDTSSPAPLCSTAAVTIFVGAPRSPVAANDTASTNETQSVSSLVLSNDVLGATSFDLLTLSVVSLPSNGVTTVNIATGAITYTPTGYYYGFDLYVYRICDQQQLCSSASVNVTVLPVGPVAAADSATASYRGTVEINVLANDKAGPAGLATLTIGTAPSASQGTASVTASNTILFTAGINFHGTASFSYVICDASTGANGALCSTAQVFVSVIGQPPIAGKSDGGISHCF